MDPALMNYLQSQQANGTGNTQAQQSNYNPFDEGISRAISSAQQSLGMTEKQQDKALRRSMLTFASNMAQQPRQRGFFNNFASVSNAMGPAIMEHDAYEDEALKQNQGMANQILAYKAAEEAKRNSMEQQSWMRQHAENQLGEQRRYHDMMNDYHRQKSNQQSYTQSESIGNGINLGNEFMPIENKAELTSYTKDKKALGSVLQEITELEKNYKKFRTDYKDNVIDPMSPYAGIANPTKDLFGKFANNKILRKETADRKTLDSQLNKFVVSSERALKGGGVMGPKLIELFKEQGIYPDLKTDTPEVFESKMNMIKEELKNAYAASNLSLQYNVRLDPYNVKDFERAIDSSITENNSHIPIQEVSAQQQVSNNNFISMRDANGATYSIPENEVNEAMQDGLTPIQ